LAEETVAGLVSWATEAPLVSGFVAAALPPLSVLSIRKGLTLASESLVRPFLPPLLDLSSVVALTYALVFDEAELDALGFLT